MNELRRMAYLDALGVDSYVSRTQQPGAAVTRRLAIVAARPAARQGTPPDAQALSVFPRLRESNSSAAAGRVARNDAALDSSVPVPGSSQRGDAVPRFSLTAIVAGDWLWLEELAGMPLATEQVRLVQSMAQALRLSLGQGEDVGSSASRPEVVQFDWPIHTNHQLDLGPEAARASVAGFVARRLEQHGCSGLVLLGRPCVGWVAVEGTGVLTVSTASSAEILAQPTLKRQAWRDLLPLVSQS